MTISNLSNYELKRKLNMEENQNLLKELGLTSLTTSGIAADIPKVNTEANMKKRRLTYRHRTPTPKQPTRLSRRIRGETPEEITELSAIVDDHDRIRQLSVPTATVEVADIEHSLPDEIYVPLTLRSIGTTIWELGELNTGKGRSKSWSSRGCKYKHPYPIGYRATKSHFGNDYVMGILSPPNEDSGPIFEVQLADKNIGWKGNTPTAPWTEACLKSKSSNTRVSGPLFFGFSDPLTMKLIEKMKGYQEASLS
ncbi:uncharacterized protein BX663DRAFT_524909, partial [Cokeromyces recurvatus]|uniref:uncharacterized protein n=1 Tax=Cokeromyces recurvatus TaxID=90255 RepID=UPI00221EFE14